VVCRAAELGERIENRHLDALFEPQAQLIGIALPPHLGAHPRKHLVRVDRADDIVIDPHIEAPEQTAVVARLGDHQDGQMARPVE
jgi:hypothetical protein